MYAWLKYEKKMVRKSVKRKMIEGVDKEELVLLKFTPEQQAEHLNWKHSKEFEYAGEMYDIVERFTKNDTTYFYCWWDQEETALNRQLDRLVADLSQSHPQKNDSQNLLGQLFKSFYWSEPAIERLSVLTENIKHFFHYQFAVKEHKLDNHWQPPAF